ncbi:MAG: 30S ribosomal protein S6e [Candidatus Diapherotrites archaeon]
MNIVISNPKTGKAYSKKTETPVFIGSKVGDEVSLDVVGLSGYKVKILGGSDKQGFPMKPTLPGTGRKRALLSKGTGFNPTSKGQRKRISVRGNEINENISQLNVIITKMGDADIDMLLGKKEEKAEAGTEEKTEDKAEKKEDAKPEKKKEEKKDVKTDETKKDMKKQK